MSWTITAAARAVLRRWASDDEPLPEMRVSRRDVLALLDVLDAADALREVARLHCKLLREIPYDLTAAERQCSFVEAALARYDALVERP